MDRLFKEDWTKKSAILRDISENLKGISYRKTISVQITSCKLSQFPTVSATSSLSTSANLTPFKSSCDLPKILYNQEDVDINDRHTTLYNEAKLEMLSQLLQSEIVKKKKKLADYISSNNELAKLIMNTDNVLV